MNPQSNAMPAPGPNASQSQSQSQSRATSATASDRMLFDGYERHPKAWDELFGANGLPHEHCSTLAERLGSLTVAEFQQLRANADLVFINQGITFSVYADRRGTEKIFPYDLIPRPVSSKEWVPMETGLVQRIKALNLFLHDVYHDRKILKDGVVPESLVLESKAYRPCLLYTSDAADE